MCSCEWNLFRWNILHCLPVLGFYIHSSSHSSWAFSYSRRLFLMLFPQSHFSTVLLHSKAISPLPPYLLCQSHVSEDAASGQTESTFSLMRLWHLDNEHSVHTLAALKSKVKSHDVPINCIWSELLMYKHLSWGYTQIYCLPKCLFCAIWYFFSHLHFLWILMGSQPPTICSHSSIINICKKNGWTFCISPIFMHKIQALKLMRSLFSILAEAWASLAMPNKV